ncbi:MAG: hypothetical protein LUD29_05380 [Clostridia bacterium]|nr:hypothetical protein [Clostridia bacterium]
MKGGKKYTSMQGKYPVIYLDFKEVTQGSHDDAMRLMSDILSFEFSRHKEFKRSLRVNREYDLKTYKKIVWKKS